MSLQSLRHPELKSQATPVNDSLIDKDLQPEDEWRFLRKRQPPRLPVGAEPVRVVDLFCGCGGLSLGAMEACRALSRGFSLEVALDKDPVSVEVFRQNFRC